LYYDFQDKAGLFEALVHQAHDARYEVLRAAAARGSDICEQLENILTDLFAYVSENRELTRISFATMFAAPGEIPENLHFADKCERNFEFVHSLIRQAQARGELDRRFESRELAFGFYGLANFYLVSHLVRPGAVPDQQGARRIVDLFLTGAGVRQPAAIRVTI
jgi:AcrR family transcriptional regulator